MKTGAIVFICDDNYAMQTSVAITSLIENKLKNISYDIFIIGSDLSYNSIGKFRNLKCEDTEINIIESSCNKYRCLHTDNSSAYMVATHAALLKFDIANIVPGYQKALYLDGDIIVKKDISHLFSIDLADKYAAVVRDVPQVLYDKPIINTGTGIDYFNSGVMLLNLKLLREKNICKTLVNTKKDLKDTTLMDQNVFNIVFERNVIQLPVTYNVLYANLARNWKHRNIKDPLNKLYHTEYNSLEDIYLDATIIHFSSKDKPWKYFDAPLADEWLYYYMRSPYATRPLIRNSVLDHKIMSVNRKYKNIDKVEIIPIVFATNSHYIPYMNVAIQSLIENASKSSLYDIYIFCSDISEYEKSLTIDITNENVLIRFIDVSKISEQISQLCVCAHYSKEMYYRWFIPEILPQYEKVLYLDCDVVILKDIKLLYNYELHGATIGGIANICDKTTQLRIQKNFQLEEENYINSGVLLINTRDFILNKIKSECIRMAKTLRKEVLSCPDQDIINIACKDQICMISDEWNYQWHHQWDADERKLDIYVARYNEARKNIGLLHFTSGIKPWSNPDRPLAHYFWKYARLAPNYESILYKNILTGQKGKDRELNVSMKGKNYNSSSNYYREELGRVKASVSFRLGRFITFVPRKIRGGIRCYKEHGMSYTINRVKGKLHDLFGKR